MKKTTVNVAIALLFHQGQVLVGWRQAKQHQGNKYEFPGGKVEVDETPMQACRRETLEEVGIDIEHWHVFDDIYHEYEDINVHLHLFHASVEANQLDQIVTPWAWYSRHQLRDLNFPKANDVIIHRLIWPKSIVMLQHYPADVDLQSEQFFYLGHQKSIQVMQSMSDEMKRHWIIHLDMFNQLSSLEQKKYAAVCIGTVELNAFSDKREQGIDDSHNQANPSINLPIGIKTVASCENAQQFKIALAMGVDAIMYVPNVTSECVGNVTIQNQQDGLKRVTILHQYDPLRSNPSDDLFQFKSMSHVPVYL